MEEFKQIYTENIRKYLEDNLYNINMSFILNELVKIYVKDFQESKGINKPYNYNIWFEIKVNHMGGTKYCSSISLTLRVNNNTVIHKTIGYELNNIEEIIKNGKLLKFYIESVISICNYIIHD